MNSFTPNEKEKLQNEAEEIYQNRRADREADQLSWTHEKLLHEFQMLQVQYDSIARHLSEAEEKIEKMTNEHLSTVSQLKATEEELMRIKRKYAVLFEDSLQPAVLLKLPEKIFVNVNKAFEKLYGSSEAEFVGKPLAELGFTDSGSASLFDEIIMDGAVSKKEFTLCVRSGEERVLEFNKNEVSFDREQYAIITINDITEQKRAASELKHSQETFLQIFRFNPASLAITRLADGKFIMVNKAYSKVIGYEAEELIGHLVTEFNIYLQPSDRESVLNLLRQNGYVRNYELQVRSKSGEIKTIVNFIEPLQYLGEDCVLSTFLDITEHRSAELALQKNRAMLEAALSSMNDAIFFCDTDGLFIDFNAAFAHFHRFRDKDECPKTLSEYPAYMEVYLLGGEPAPFNQWAVSSALRGETASNVELRIRRKDTGESWVGSYSYAPILGDGGAILGAVITARDITEQKKAQIALQQSEQKYSVLFDKAAIPASLTKLPENTFVQINDAFEKVFGYTQKEVYGKTSIELGIARPEEQEKTISELKRNGTLLDIEKHIYSKSGERKTILVNVNTVMIDKQSYAITTVHDITERRRVEQALFESVHRLSSTMDNMIEGCQILDYDWRYLYINDSAQSQNRRSRTEMLGRTYTECWPGIETTQVYAVIHKCLTERKSHHFINYFVFPDKNFGWFELSLQAVPEGVFILSIDISERKRAEKDLLASMEQVRLLNAELEQKVCERTAELSDLYNNAPCGYHSVGETGLIERINDTELKWLGYSREEVVHKLFLLDLLTKESRKQFEHNFPTFKATGQIEDLQLDFLRKDGSVLPVLISATAIFDQNKHYVCSRTTLINFTERKKAEQELRQMHAKLQATNKELEAFSYSVSHDLRAPLRSIDGFSQLILKNYSDVVDETGKDYLNRVRCASQRMELLIDNLLQLSRIVHFEMKTGLTDLSEMAKSIADELQKASLERSSEFLIADDIKAVGDPNLLNILLRNLLGNAWKYSSKKQHTIIELGIVEGTSNTIFIRDNGAGFEMKYASKLFGAFQRLHSPKDFEGTGIGLATVQRIINRHGGRIWAEAELDRGATFYFTL